YELLALISGQPEQSAHDSVRAYWQRQTPAPNGSTALSAGFDAFWRKSLNDGLIANSAARTIGVTLNRDALRQLQPVNSGSGIEIVFRPDPSIYDGRFANNAWLQELPKPFTKLTWDNAALMGPTLARRLHVDTGDIVELQYQNRAVRAPVWVLPGQAEDVVTVHLGYGRTRAGKVGNDHGFDANAIRTSDAPWFATGVDVRKVGEDWRLATTQHQQTVEGRSILRAGTLKEYHTNPNFVKEMDEHHERGSMYPEYKYDGYKWGMAINIGACVGCNACIVACNAENNIPVVGKNEVLRDRKMHWLRVDAYYTGTPDDPQTHFQPVPCMHCETAPCEVVCPVEATSHSAEGLNEMTYNRCIGTRYCSNNCPYKVRRFNFFQYTDYDTPSLKLLSNPDVTVRSRGVMEKCT
ncbi:MAG: 4Fe-4S dicluster domain-containing protein, partial [Chloroflexi bacterium]|nr:4Fe-4S dicluster domain-containing protein [Chloroflexota bacterium]